MLKLCSVPETVASGQVHIRCASFFLLYKSQCTCTEWRPKTHPMQTCPELDHQNRSGLHTTKIPERLRWQVIMSNIKS